MIVVVAEQVDSACGYGCLPPIMLPQLLPPLVDTNNLVHQSHFPITQLSPLLPPVVKTQ